MAYYLDGPSLALATSVYTDAELTICAPDGVYSDGSITRVLAGCVLGSSKFCPSCGEDCGNRVDNNTKLAGTYSSIIDLGNDPGNIGAVIVRFNPLDLGGVETPKGIIVTYDGVNYNTFSSPVYGLLTAPTNLPVYIGRQSDDCGIVSGSPFVLPNNNWDVSSGSYVYNGTTSAVSVLPSQVQTNISSAGECIMVIPKLSLNPSSLDITVHSPCLYAGFKLTVECPTSLFPTYTSQVGITPDAICQYEDNLIYYNAPVNGNGTILGLFDWIFIDINGEVLASDGYYYAPSMLPNPYDWFFVQSGIITQMGQCTYNGFVLRRCTDGQTLVAGFGGVPGVTIGDFVTITNPLYSACVWEVIANSSATPTETIDTLTPYTSCSDSCASYSIDNMTGSTQTANYVDCAGASQSVSVAAYSTEYVCARVGSVTVPGSPAGVLVTVDSCSC